MDRSIAQGVKIQSHSRTRLRRAIRGSWWESQEALCPLPVASAPIRSILYLHKMGLVKLTNILRQYDAFAHTPLCIVSQLGAVALHLWNFGTSHLFLMLDGIVIWRQCRTIRLFHQWPVDGRGRAAQRRWRAASLRQVIQINDVLEVGVEVFALFALLCNYNCFNESHQIWL